MPDQISDFLPTPVFPVPLSVYDLDLLIHFAEIGQNTVVERDAFGDRAVASELTPILRHLHDCLQAAVRGR